MINWNSVKIVATAGPASSSYKTLKAMFNKGLDIVRINFSHGKYEEYKKTIKLVRKIENEIGRPLGILADMPGPKLRVRGIEKPITVKPGSLLVIRKLAPKNDGEISIAYPVILKVLKPGDKISISDGKFTIRVISKTKDTVTCKVIDGTGEIRKGAGLNFPEVDLPIPSVTPEDFKHISFACAHGVDFIGLSFIKEADDLAKVRKHLKKIKASPFLISKIERRAALANLKSIVHATDGVMVARGDLGVEMPIEKVNLLQKEIIKMCNANGKPVITATQMLESMIENPSPTRAEVSDVANAVFDGTDAIMLSGETAIGKFPLLAVEMMYKIARNVEPKLDRTKNVAYLSDDDLSDIISKNVVRIAEVYGVKDILVPTESGKTARMVSRYRPNARIIALTSNEKIQRQLVLPFGVYPCRIKKHANSSVIFKVVDEFIKKSKLFKKGDKIIIAAGTLEKKGSASNFVKIMTVD